MITLQTLPIEQIKLNEMPFYHRHGAANGSTYIRCGAVKRGGNEPYCYTEEKQCAGHICRILSLGQTVGSSLVIRDDGTWWRICFNNFLEIVRLEIIKEDGDCIQEVH